MGRITDRDRLLRLVQGEALDDEIIYEIEFSVDIRGGITVFSGSEFLMEECPPNCDNTKRVNRRLVPIYENPHLYPYTSRIFQMEGDIAQGLSDDVLIEEFRRFREAHQADGFSHATMIKNISMEAGPTDEDGRQISYERTDKKEVIDRLLKQERQDILNLWGIDCPPNINDSEHYGQRLSRDRGQVSDWFREEFVRIGGDWGRLWGQGFGV